jgi:uncharacterized protein
MANGAGSPTRHQRPRNVDLAQKPLPPSQMYILKTNTNITMLVNNAGFGATAPLLQSDIDRMEDMVSTT